MVLSQNWPQESSTQAIKTKNPNKQPPIGNFRRTNSIEERSSILVIRRWIRSYQIEENVVLIWG